MKGLKKESGFSLLEMIMVLLVLTLVMGVVFNAIARVQKQYRQEEERVDTLQNARELVDQISRDMHNSGYPNNHMYSVDKLASDPSLAKGLIAISKTEILLEGDMGQTTSGNQKVTVIRYKLVSDANDGTCPCSLQRMSNDKPANTLPEAVNAPYTSAVDNVANNVGGTGAWTISGTNMNGSALDTVYAAMKTEPVFRFFDKDGNELTVPDSLPTSNAFDAATLSLGQSAKVMTVSLNILAPYADLQTGSYATATVRTSLRVPNR